MSTQSICPNCKQPIDEQTFEGLCAACLMLAGVGSTMDQPQENDADPISESPGTQIGRYKLLEQIGEGGFGVVYMAEQQEPVRRRVALKVIKPGMDSKQIIARFEAERQALAMMDHENIARVLDAGTSESGRPYFVMELVRGLPITEYCDRNKLKPSGRLELMIDVCRAIQHAHQKGIIHRDIKPSNVLVTLYDGRPVPKVIDFGVAKAIQQPLTEKTMFTRFGQVMGTLEYMSPEQAEMSGLDIDTRGDIYSLGVLMYELLTGTTPLSREKLRSAAIDEVLRIIRNEEPPRPSLRLDQSGEARKTISNQRGMAPDKLESVLRGELDWIVMKALEKDRARRYENANEFANDIRRFLNDEPIEAAPPSSLYRFRKFVRKHGAAVSTVAAIVGALLVGLIASLIYYQDAVESREAADRFAAQLQDERERLVESLEQTRKEEAEKTIALNEKALALKQRTAALVKSDTLRLAAESLRVADEDPGLALRLASDALGLDDQSIQANSSFLNAVAGCHEIKTIMFDGKITHCSFARGAERAFLHMDSRIEVWDLRTNKAICRIEIPKYINLHRIVPNPNGTRFVLLINGWKGYKKDAKTFYVTDRCARLFDVSAGKEVSVLRGHTDRIESVCFSEDGSRILTASWDGTARLWDSHSGKPLVEAKYNPAQSTNDEREQKRISRHVEKEDFSYISLGDAEFNRDGTISLFPITGRKKSVLVFEEIEKIVGKQAVENAGVPAGAIENALKKDEAIKNPPFRQVTSDFESNGGGTAVSVGVAGIKPCEQVFSAQTGEYQATTKRSKTISENQADVSSKLVRQERFESTSKSKPLIAKIAGKQIALDRYQKESLMLRGHRYRILNLGYDSNRDHIVSCDKQSIRVWRTASLLKQITSKKLAAITCTAVDRTGSYLASGHGDGSVSVWNVNTGHLEADLIRSYDFFKKEIPNTIRPKIEFIQFDSTGKKIVCCSKENAIILGEESDGDEQLMSSDVVRVWSWREEQLEFRLARRRTELDRPRYLGFSMAVFDEADVVTIDSGQHGVSYVNDEGDVTANYAGDGLSVRDKNGKPLGPFLAIRRWNTKRGEPEFEIFSDAAASPPSISSLGKFATIRMENNHQLIDLSNGTKCGSLPNRLYIRDKSLFVTDDARVAIVLDYSVDEDSGRFAKFIDTSSQEVTEIAVDDVAEIGGAQLTSGCWNPDQTKLAVSVDSGYLLVFDLVNKSVNKILGHSDSILKVAYSSDGSRLVTASKDRFCRVWDAASQKQVLEFGPHELPVTDFQLDPNNRFVLAISEGGVITRWPLVPKNLLEGLDSPFNPELPRQLTGAEVSRFQVHLVEENAGD